VRSSREGANGSHRHLLQKPSNSRLARQAKLSRNSRRPARNSFPNGAKPHRICRVAATIRQYDPHDLAALFKLDQSCFPPGIAYSKTMLRYFLAQPGAECLIAMDGTKIVGFLISQENPPLGHIVTLDVVESHRRQGIGSLLLHESEAHLAFRGVRTVLLETATTNDPGVAFWERHGYRKEAVLKNYYPGRLDAFEMRKLLSATTRSGS
jgi:ribosomal-protein-alanine N-acetyltransferase